jgi:hypothetical protein
MNCQELGCIEFATVCLDGSQWLCWEHYCDRMHELRGEINEENHSNPHSGITV